MKSSRDIIIQVKDLQKAKKFYETIMGFPVVHLGPNLVGFETGSFCLYIEEDKPYGPVLEFYVSNLEEAKNQLLNSGCKIVDENPSVPRCYFKDPFGLIFNIAEK